MLPVRRSHGERRRWRWKRSVCEEYIASSAASRSPTWMSSACGAPEPLHCVAGHRPLYARMHIGGICSHYQSMSPRHARVVRSRTVGGQHRLGLYRTQCPTVCNPFWKVGSYMEAAAHPAAAPSKLDDAEQLLRFRVVRFRRISSESRLSTLLRPHIVTSVGSSAHTFYSSTADNVMQT